MNANLLERFGGRSRFPNTHTAISTAFDNDLDLTLNLDIREYVFAQDKIKQFSDKDAWLSMPELPTTDELDIAESSVLPNKIEGPYKSKDRYLKTQYSLLREDAVGSLRDALQDLKKNPDTNDAQNFSVYDQVGHSSRLRN